VTDDLIQVMDLKKHFTVRNELADGGRRRTVKAVDGVSFSIRKRETFGLVGESGCGKSTLGRTLTRLYDATGGSVSYEGADITRLPERELKPYRRKMQVIFQDPYSSLNPYMTVEQIVAEPVDIHLRLSLAEKRERIEGLLEKVGIQKGDMEKFPHEFSGGQRQRIGIARALSVDPDFIMCDEPISALDVSIQAQIVNVLEALQAELGLTYLFIAHNLLAVRHISDRIGVMYLGKLVEAAESRELFKSPLHPYTRALLSAIPIPDPKLARAAKRELLEGDLPSPFDLPSGCRFRTRCPLAEKRCAEGEPEFREAAGGHWVACHVVA
jgi:oligopeptide/dipeptide ABC transporter ATP-binding protein